MITEEPNYILLQEETKVWQRSGDRYIVEGDRNTVYFDAVANQRRRKNKIDVLNGPSRLVNDTKSMLNIAVSSYKDLFSCDNAPNIALGSKLWDERVTFSLMRRGFPSIVRFQKKK
jgi:hypothetical protein